MSDITKGRILYVIKNGKSFFTEIEEETGASSATLGRYLRELEKDGLIISVLDRSTGRARPRYKLNESRIDEINKLINAYLEHEKKEVEEKMQVIKQVIPEKERIRMASYFITVDEEKRKRIEKMLEEILSEGEAK